MNFLRRMGNSWARFMYGRNGVDQLNYALLILGLVLLAVLVVLELRFARHETLTCGILLPAGLMILAVVATCVIGARSTLRDVDFMIQMLLTFVVLNIPAYLLLGLFVIARGRYLKGGR